MPEVKSYKTTQFARNFGAIRDEVFSEGVVEVYHYKQLVGAYLSPAEYLEYLEWKEAQADQGIVNAA